MAKEKMSVAVNYLEKLRGDPLTLGALVRSSARPTSTPWKTWPSASASRATTSATLTISVEAA
ncbi:MAG: hypothetical protein ACJ79W_15045 [Myxococcales bacterium]